MVYFERQWVPWWVVTAIFAGVFTVLFGFFRVITLVRPAAPPMDSVYVQLIPCVGVALLVAVLCWISMGRLHTITVDEHALRFSLGFGSTPLTDIEAVAIVRGDGVRKMREDLAAALEPNVPTPAILLIPLTPAFASASYLLGNIPRTRAVQANPWMHEAVAVFASGTTTPIRLIGTRHPDELVAAIKRGAGLAESAPSSAPLS